LVILYKVIATPKEKEQWLKLYKMPDRVIPVVFLPGVMGSNLMSPMTANLSGK
jgi:hypothetical protein